MKRITKEDLHNKEDCKPPCDEPHLNDITCEECLNDDECNCILHNLVENNLDSSPMYRELIKDLKMEKTTLYSGMTGEKLDEKIFMGLIYMQRLKHMSKDKIYSRTKGPTQPLTRQPKEGRSVMGGHRVGLQERDCLLSHGCVSTLNERTFHSSDKAFVDVCEKCGIIFHGYLDDTFAKCKVCDNDTFVRVPFPSSSKLVLNLTTPCNIIFRLMPKTD